MTRAARRARARHDPPDRALRPAGLRAIRLGRSARTVARRAGGAAGRLRRRGVDPSVDLLASPGPRTVGGAKWSTGLSSLVLCGLRSKQQKESSSEPNSTEDRCRSRVGEIICWCPPSNPATGALEPFDSSRRRPSCYHGDFAHGAGCDFPKCFPQRSLPISLTVPTSFALRFRSRDRS